MVLEETDPHDDGDRENYFVSIVDETQIGRIYKERGPAGVKWLWSLQAARAPSPNRGIADTLDEAKAALAKRYEELKRGR